MMFADIPLFPEQASTHAARVDGLLFFLLAVAAVFSIGIAATLIYFAVKYRRRSDTDRPGPTPNSIKLELTWTLIPLVISLFIFVWGAQLYLSWARPPDDALEIYVVAKQWMWKMQHLGGEREINRLHVPLGRPVKLTLISQDVIHSFYVPAFRIHQDVLPNRYTTVWFEPTKTGVYHLFCSQYCGTHHAKMVGDVVVLSPEDYQAWLTHDADGSMASKGRQLFQKLQCVTCHSAESGARGPVLENLFGRQVHLQDGQVVRADESYLRESIINPDAKVVAGFKSIMPSFKGQVSEEEILELVTFLKGLRAGQTPRRVEEADPPAVHREQGAATVPGLKMRKEK